MSTQIFKRCPECEAEIDHLRYSIQVMEYGTADITTRGLENYNSNDSSSDGNEFCYECPECNAEISEDDLLDISDDDDDNSDDEVDEQILNKHSDKWEVQ
jgi:hypothetical protein